MNNYSNNTRSMNGLNNINASGGTFDDITTNTLTVNSSSSVPTRPNGDSTLNIANTTFVTSAISTAGTNYVNLNGIQTISGLKDFSVLPTSSLLCSSNSEFANKQYVDSVSVSLTGANAWTGNTNTFNSYLPTSTITAISGNELVNLTTLNGAITTASSAYAKLASSNTFTSTNTFNTNTLTATAGITVKNGASAQTATLTQNSTTLDVIGSGDISIKPTNDFNVVTGTGKDVNISTPDSALLLSTQTYTTGYSNASSYIALASPTTYILGMSTQPSLILSGGYGTIYGWQFTRGGTNIAAINRINSQNTLDTCYLEVNEGQNITLTNGVTSITGDFLIQQTTYPPSNNSALGYTNSETTLTDPMSNTLAARSDFSIPSKGVWLIICGYEWNTNTSNTVESKLLVLSLTSAGTTPVAYGLDYYEEINDAAGASGDRQKGTLSGVVSVTGATTIYVNARSQVNSGTNTELRTNITWTRIA